MAFSLKSKPTKKRQIISDINITPFVDVLLVLLIIFMVTAPMLTSDIDISLPKGAASEKGKKEQSVAISIKIDGTIFLQDEKTKLSLLPSKLVKTTNGALDTEISIRADKGLDYGRVIEVVKMVNIAGFNQVALVTEMEQ